MHIVSRLDLEGRTFKEVKGDRIVKGCCEESTWKSDHLQFVVEQNFDEFSDNDSCQLVDRNFEAVDMDGDALDRLLIRVSVG